MRRRPSIHRLIALQHFLLSFRAIDRKLHIPPGLEEYENDVEHSYALAMTAWFMAAYFPSLNRDELIRLSLAHDIVEIYAGDTYSYSGAETLKQKDEFERAAMDRLEQEWADFPEMLETLHAYKGRATNEAKFIYALDKLMPAMLEYINEGRGWRHHGITFADYVAEKNKKIPVSPEINEYSQELIRILDKQRHLFPVPRE